MELKWLRTLVDTGGKEVTGTETLTEDRYRLTLTTEQDGARIEQEVSAVFEFAFLKQDVVFLNGYQSWTYSPEWRTDQFDVSMRFIPSKVDALLGLSRYSDLHFTRQRTPVEELRKGYKKGYSYAYVRRGSRFYLFGSLSEDTGFTRIEFRPQENTITFVKDCAGRQLKKGETYTALDLIFLEGRENEVFDAWFDAMGIRPLPAKPKVGYTSWYNCYQKISELQIAGILEGMKALDVRPDILQIDDGYETFTGDWFDVDEEKFPDGLDEIVGQILHSGFQAGIWLAPFLCDKKSKLYREHPDWMLQEDGKPMYAGLNMNGGYYALDFYHPEVQDYIQRVIAHYKEMGFTLFKLDFLYAACLLPRPDKTRGEIMAEAMEFLREVCGDAQILGCGVPLASAFGRVEYCRIGPDMSLSLNDKIFTWLANKERPSTLHTRRNTVYRRQLDGRAFLNDPDVFLLRDENTSLTPEQKEILGRINALFGSVLFTSDEFASYDAQKLAFFEELCALQKAENIEVVSFKPGRTHRIIVRYLLNGKTRHRELLF